MCYVSARHINSLSLQERVYVCVNMRNICQVESISLSAALDQGNRANIIEIVSELSILRARYLAVKVASANSDSTSN